MNKNIVVGVLLDKKDLIKKKIKDVESVRRIGGLMPLVKKRSMSPKRLVWVAKWLLTMIRI